MQSIVATIGALVLLLFMAAPTSAQATGEADILISYLAEYDEVEGLPHCARNGGQSIATFLIGEATGERVSAPATNRLLFVHVSWHNEHEPHGIDNHTTHDDDHFGDEFFRYHRYELDRFDAFRLARGLEPVEPWNPENQPPNDFDLAAGQECEQRNDPYVPVTQPTWTKLAGGSEADPLFGYTALCQFQDTNQIGKSITNGYHASIHAAVGGALAGPDPMMDPLFWASHRFLDNIVVAYETACVSETTGGGQQQAVDSATRSTPAPSMPATVAAMLVVGAACKRSRRASKA